MSNAEIIATEANKKGYDYNGSNLLSFYEWSKKGYKPIKGQKAFIKPYLWTLGVNRRKKIVALFTNEQVIKIY